MQETIATPKVSIVLLRILNNRTKMVLEIKDRIIVKTKALFMDFGIRSITMDEVASQCGISKKTLYLHFKDKDELVANVFNFEINKIETTCSQLKEHSDNAIHEIFLEKEMAVEMFGKMNPVLLTDMEKFYPTTFQLFEVGHKNFIYKNLCKNLARGIQEGIYRNGINADIIARMRVETMMMPWDFKIFPKNKYSMTEVMLELVDHFLYGITNAKGQKLIEKYKQKETKISKL